MQHHEKQKRRERHRASLSCECLVQEDRSLELQESKAINANNGDIDGAMSVSQAVDNAICSPT